MATATANLAGKERLVRIPVPVWTAKGIARVKMEEPVIGTRANALVRLAFSVITAV